MVRTLFSKRKIEIAVGTAAVILLLGGFLAARTINASRNSAELVSHTYTVLATLDDLQASIAEMISTSRGYALTRDGRFIEAAQTSAKQAISDQSKLRSLTRNNLRQQELIPILQRRVEQSIRTAERLQALGPDNVSMVLSRDTSLQRSSASLAATLSSMKSHELELLARRLESTRSNFALSETMLIGGTIFGLAITVLAGLGAARDNRKRQAAEAALFVEKERAQITLSSIGDGVISTDVSARITFINHAATVLTGWSASEAVGRPFSEVFNIINAQSREPVSQRMGMAIRHGRTVHLPDNTVLVGRDGTETPIEDTATPIYGADGEISGAVKVFRDVSAVRALTERLHHWAQHDVLTGLPNRILFNDRLNQALAFAKREKTMIAVLFLDLDEFKKVNDHHGHAIGDKLLQGVGLRVRQCLRECDTLCRLGGDEFVVLLTKINSVDDAKRAGERILSRFGYEMMVDGCSLNVTCSIGIAVCPHDADSAEALVVCADAAMYSAKLQGRNNVCLFHEADPTIRGPRKATA